MKRRKAFTLVELVIVIAIIVILAAVLIPTFSGVIEKANNAKDFSLVSEMNKVLALEEATDGKNETMHDAALVLEEYGMDIEKLPSSKGYIYVWNSKENRVAALNKDYKLVFPQGEEIKDSNKENYFAVAKTEEEINKLYEHGYSVYLKENASVNKDISIRYGFDMGNNQKVRTVNYTGGATAKSVIIRTNSYKNKYGRIVEIDIDIVAEKDSVSHYGEANKVRVTAVANYHEFGTCNTIEVTKGHILVESNAKIGDLIVKSEASSVKITNENKGSIENFVVETETNKDVNITYNGKSGSLEEIKSDIAKDANIIVLGDENAVNMVSTKEELTKIVKIVGYNKKPVAVTLANSLKLSSALSISSKVFIDLNGFTLTSTAMNTLKLNAGADVTVSSSKESGMITNEYSGSADATTIDLVGKGAIFTLESGTVQSNAKDNLYTLAIGNSKKKACTVNINGGIVCNPNGHENSRAIKASNGMTVNINDGKICGGESALAVYEGSVSNINGGELWANGTVKRDDEYGTSYAIYANGEATINIGSEGAQTIPNVKGIKFESSGVNTELPTITLVKGNITNPVYSKEKKYNYELFKLKIKADAEVTFVDDTAKVFLPDGLEMVQEGNVWKVK